ncbi:BREX-2 system adenine-specific DNA-methyltransferase PglX [Streptomyces sp900105755]|uniref:site-specific DNA-methyltransferase (adenine-specific) n=1 Tax=Streptomyces sp. 900105755 TaxID=3154389 RepID=A0ABV1TW85_9ACTN
MSGRGVNKTELLKDLRKQVKTLEDDLRERSEAVAEYKAKLEAEYAHAREAKRTAATYGAWRDERITQVAAAWVLACVFVRFCEDNRLIADPFLAGPGERLKDAEDRDAEFFRLNPDKNDRDWLVHAFGSLAATNPAVAGLFDRAHNPLWQLAPSYEAASALLKFWRRRGSDGEILHDFTDEPVVGADGVVEHEGWSTRFLGDLYQDLSDHARETYALLQTPEFVEEFVLDLTLEPAVKEFGLEPEVEIYLADGGTRKLPPGLRTIDPACGSGHFLLGMFQRLLGKWQEAEPGADVWTLIRRTAGSIHGCDKNPFAVSIARFRLLIAALQASGKKSLDGIPEFPINVAVGDSLLHGRGASGVQGILPSGNSDGFSWKTEDAEDYVRRCDLLGRGSYHVVVGNPPYIDVEDELEKAHYRLAYSTATHTIPLSVIFIQRLFELAIRGTFAGQPSGYSGQITSNAFMKRNYGKVLIESYLPTIDLTHVIDSSRAHIPGHNREGTPTVILVGRNKSAARYGKIRMVTGILGEISKPPIPSRGAAWLEISRQAKLAGEHESKWAYSFDLDSSSLSRHPWILQDHRKQRLTEFLTKGRDLLRDCVEKPIGRAIRAGADDAFTRPPHATFKSIAATNSLRPFLSGKSLRDWGTSSEMLIVYPYAPGLDVELLQRELWPLRTILAGRRTFKGDMSAAGLSWWEYMQHTSSAYESPLSIAFAFKASHNHFSLIRGEYVFNRHAPVIKLPNDSSEDSYFKLLDILNSSTCCFLMRELAQHQGGGSAEHPWSWTHEFTGAVVGNIPIAALSRQGLSRELDGLARQLSAVSPAAICNSAIPDRTNLDAGRAAYSKILSRMIALQEELDWEAYGSYGLFTEAEMATLTAADLDNVPGLKLGERAFEIVLARKVAAGEIVETAWFSRHHSTPVTEIPAYWPDWYQAIVQSRIDVIEKRKDIALIERPECKRRWASQPWQKREKEALLTWLLDRAEDRRLWFALRDGFNQPRTLTISQLADQLSRLSPEVSAVAATYAADHLGNRDLPLEVVLTDAINTEHVPYLAALRYKEASLPKYQQWVAAWEWQREEDRNGVDLGGPVPDKYGASDFKQPSYWSNRGTLDVPKERFVSYPDASPDADPTLLLGWAGWDYRDQAQALVNLVKDRTSKLSWDNARITPLLAGLAELMPWVRQWFGTDDHEWGGNAAEEFGTFLDTERTKRGLTAEQLTSWRPAPKTRGRKSAITAHTAKKTETAADTETA